MTVTLPFAPASRHLHRRTHEPRWPVHPLQQVFGPVFLALGWLLLGAALLNLSWLWLPGALGWLWLREHLNTVRARQEARTDALTGLPNRRALDEGLRRALRSATPLSALLLDLDHFKRLNDRHGHLAGDQALRRVASVLRAALRSQDLCGRWGGEEFLVLLPGLTQPQAVRVAERLRGEIERQLDVHGEPVTVSVGVAGPVTGAAPDVLLERLLEAADTALYDAKRAGRNRVVLSQDEAA